jgi:hypothetical protein
MRVPTLVLSLGALSLAEAASGYGSGSPGTRVIHTGKAPTGYEVEFHFHPNRTIHPKFVVLGGFGLYTNTREASSSKMTAYSPWEWVPEDFALRTGIWFCDFYHGITS